MTLKEVKDIVAKRHGYDSWKYFLRHTFIYSQIMEAEDECMVLYAQHKCEEQKVICHSENSLFPEFE